MARKRKNKTINLAQAKTRVITGMWLVVVLIVLFFIGRYIAGGASAQEPAADDSAAPQLELVKLPAGISNSVVRYAGFTVYFNPQYHIPNCVAYELTAEKAEGTVPRAKNFLADDSVKGCAQPWDYQYSGYDRGHMAPAGDMKWDADAMKASFYMTNICPQVKALNTGAWNKLESRVREWVKRDSALIVITGPILSDDMPTIGGKAAVAVPPKFFKVILAHKATPMRAIAFIYDNARSSSSLAKHAATVDDVELATGLDFFSALPDDQETAVESQFDLRQWSIRGGN